ncbi:hypothetical protein [Streptomyces yanii]|uniref:Uncharacterized protein n=1 Tax=Streptomyces yanii TaxID=78510 RepID=A0ABV5RKW7_9ACTN
MTVGLEPPTVSAARAAAPLAWLARDDVNQVADMLRDEALMGLVILHPDGLWRLPEEYLPEAGQA